MSYPRYRSQSVPAVEIDEATKHKFRKHVQSKLHTNYVELGKQRDAALNSASDEEERQRALRQYNESVASLRVLADEEYQTLIRHEMAKRVGVERGDRQPESVVQEQQRILDSIQRGDGDHVTYMRSASTAPHAGRDHGARRPSITTANGTTPEFWRPPSAKPEPSGLSRTLAHATTRPPTAPPQIRRGSASGGLAGQTGVSVASEHARMRTPNPEHWNGFARQRAPSDAHRAQSPATPTVSRAQAIPSSSQHRWNDQRPSSTRPINAGARAPPNDHVAFPMSASPGARAGYPSPSSPGDTRQGIAIPRGGRLAGEDGGRSTSYGSSHLRNQSSSYRYRHDVVRESPESDDDLLEEDDDDEEQSSGDFAHSLDIDGAASPEDRRRASEEQDRKLAERLQKEEMRAAQEERSQKKRNGHENHEDFRRREEHYYRRAVERNRQGSIDGGRNGGSPSSWSNPVANGNGLHHKPIVEDAAASPGNTSRAPSRARQRENAVAGPSGSSRSSRATSESVARSIATARTNIEECLDQMLSEMLELRDEKLKLAGDDEDERDRVMDQHATGLRSIFMTLEQTQQQLQSDLQAKRSEIAQLAHRMQQNGTATLRIS